MRIRRTSGAAAATAALALGAAAAVPLAPASAAADPTLDWQHLWDGGSQQGDTGVKALADAAGNVVVAAEVTDGAGNGNLLIRKFARANGDTLWSHVVHGDTDNRMDVGDMVWDHTGKLLIGGTRLGCFG